MNKTKKITVCAMMAAVAFVLAWLSSVLPFKWAQGGSVTLASMVPIIVASIVTEWKWGLLTAVVYALLQMLLGGIPAPPVQNFTGYVLVISLDYIIAFGVLGLADVFFKMFKKKSAGIVFGAFMVCLLRFLCHLLSGVVIWGVYAPEGQSIWLYSLVYNGGYMLPETIITTVVTTLLIPVISRMKQ